MLTIRFEVTGMGMKDLMVPQEIQSPVPMRKGEILDHRHPEGNQTLEVYSTNWVIDQGEGVFYQNVSLGLRLPKKEDDAF